MKEEDFVLKFKEYSNEILIAIENKEIDKINDILEKRQILINNLCEAEYSKDVLGKLLESNHIIEEDRKINQLIAIEMEAIKKEMDKTVIQKRANAAYNNQRMGYQMFSTKI